MYIFHESILAFIRLVVLYARRVYTYHSVSLFISNSLLCKRVAYAIGLC